MAEHQWTREELRGLRELGLSITPRRVPVQGWGYTWQGHDWVGPFKTPNATLHAAFTEALQSFLFRSQYSWVQFPQPGELRCWTGQDWETVISSLADSEGE